MIEYDRSHFVVGTYLMVNEKLYVITRCDTHNETRIGRSPFGNPRTKYLGYTELNIRLTLEDAQDFNLDRLVRASHDLDLSNHNFHIENHAYAMISWQLGSYGNPNRVETLEIHLMRTPHSDVRSEET